ncbi:hypothetical protein [Paenibacillus turpanensis]|uniref:hypothetical protein n=1 Tax=Paenibacillus turpanensis TaxID=2689078 RepID=UPI00140CDEF3|nr:hypothetical protein [Paenibacillus turpanensis]
MANKNPNQESVQNINVDEAWEKMKEKLKSEPAHPLWSQLQNVDHMENKPNFSVMHEEQASQKDDVTQLSPLPAGQQTKKRSLLSMRNRKWLSGAVAASVIALVVVTPIGNQALASIINQFRMEEMTTINEQDANQFFNSFFPDGEEREFENQFSEVSRTTGTINGVYSIQDAAKALNRNLVTADWFTDDKVDVSPSERYTFTINVAEVNKVLKRLGATKLMPESVSGKPITIVLGEQVNMYSHDGEKHISFTQMPAPKVEVDPSIGVQEALDAIIDFPMLPGNLKHQLQRTALMNGGTVPLPVITDEGARRETLEGKDVVIGVNEQPGGNSYYHSVWIDEGIVYSLSGTQFTDEQQFKTEISELIRQ